MKQIYICVVPLDEVKESLGNVEEPIPAFDEMSNEDVEALASNSFDDVAGVYSLKEFEGSFNYALDEEINSSRYLIRFIEK